MLDGKLEKMILKQFFVHDLVRLIWVVQGFAIKETLNS